MRKILTLLLTLVAIGCQIQCTTDSHSLFDAGKSDYTIVIEPEASECVRYAAEELRDWMQKVSGVTLPIENDLNAGEQGKRLVVGYNNLTCQSLADITAPDGENDSFTYRSCGGDVFFWGDTDRGTLYAVYSFLERELGCRWLNSRVSVTPKSEAWSFAELNHSESPAIRMRCIFYYDVLCHPEFDARLKGNCVTDAAKYGGSLSYWACHSIPWFVSADKYYAEHPEYFAEVDGKRIANSTPCLSNPDVLRITIEETRKAMQQHPECTIYSVEQGDGCPYCHCEKCNAIKAQYGDTESGLMIWFVNQVGDALKDEFPDKYVGTFAYQHTRPAPKNITPHDNVVVRLCPIEQCQLHSFDDTTCEKNSAFLKDLDDWAQVAPRLYIWDYVATFSNYMLPMPNIWVVQNRIKHFRDGHAIGVMPQGSYQSVSDAFDDMKAYVMARLLWDPDRDINEVICEFTDAFFGEAAGPIIREYLEYERKSLIWEDNHEDLYASHEADMYTDNFIPGAKEYFARAKQAIRDAGGENVEELIEHVEYAEISVCCLELLRNPAQGKADGSFDLLKRVAEREGITIWQEFGKKTKIEDLIRIIEEEDPEVCTTSKNKATA